MKSNPFLPYVSQMWNPDLKKPRLLPLWQFYMKQPGIKNKITQEFSETWPEAGLEDKFELDFRARIAQRLLGKETEEYREGLAVQAENEH